MNRYLPPVPPTRAAIDAHMNMLDMLARPTCSHQWAYRSDDVTAPPVCVSCGVEATEAQHRVYEAELGYLD